MEDAICTLLDDLQAENVVRIDLRSRSALADFLVIASGQSQRQLAAMAERLAVMLKERGVRPVIEGEGGAEWLLIDAGDVIVHLFRPELRAFYDLERMWAVPAAADTPDKVLGA